MEKTDASLVRAVILDAGPLIHLDELGCLTLLTDFPDRIVPAAVWKEVGHHRPAALHLNTISFIQAQPPKITAAQQALCEAFNLDAGEREAMALCSLYPQAILLTDDAGVRLAAKASGMRAYGTLGVLIRAIRRKQLTPVEVIRLLEEIPTRSTLFIRKGILKEIIDKIKGEYDLR
jgi:predicted nucleic acid-binding protein